MFQARFKQVLNNAWSNKHVVFKGGLRIGSKRSWWIYISQSINNNGILKGSVMNHHLRGDGHEFAEMSENPYFQPTLPKTNGNNT